MARDAKNARSFKAAPVDDYRWKIGQHDRKVVQKESKQHQRQTEKKRNFGKSVKQSSMTFLGIFGVVVVICIGIYGVLYRFSAVNQQ